MNGIKELYKFQLQKLTVRKTNISPFIEIKHGKSKTLQFHLSLILFYEENVESFTSQYELHIAPTCT